MRNPNRLYEFYNEMTRLHMEHFSDWRFGQFMMNFLSWVSTEKKYDPFFPEEDKMLEFLREYCGETDE